MRRQSQKRERRDMSAEILTSSPIKQVARERTTAKTKRLHGRSRGATQVPAAARGGRGRGGTQASVATGGSPPGDEPNQLSTSWKIHDFKIIIYNNFSLVCFEK